MKQPKLSPIALEKYILLLAQNPKNDLQYAILQKQTKFDSVAAIYEAGIQCSEIFVQNIGVDNVQAWHYAKLSNCFFNMFDLLTGSIIE